MQNKAIIFDLDGTLCDVNHRRHFVSKHPKNWEKFFAGIPDDPVNEPVRYLHDVIYDNRETYILYCTGRSEEYREVTKEWLYNNIGVRTNSRNLFMRPLNDSRPDQVVKEEMWRKIESMGYEIVLMIDDRDSVVKHARSLGYTVLQCDTGDFEPIHSHTPADGECLLSLMVGPSGAGKTNYVNTLKSLGNTIEVISTDDVRALMSNGDFKDQSKNDAVFQYVKEKVLLNMRYGIKTIVDATHLHRKDRLAHVSLAPANTVVEYIVVDRPLEDKLEDGGWRLYVKFKNNGKIINLVEKHHETFKSSKKEILNGDGLANVRVVNSIEY